MPTKMMMVLIRQMFRKPYTNRFPVKYAPKDVTGLIQKVMKGEVKIHPPVPVPEDFRGKLAYDPERCIGCKMCIRVCPANAMEFIPETKKIRHYVARCMFCALCVDVCPGKKLPGEDAPVKALKMSEEFLLADYDKYSKNLVLE